MSNATTNEGVMQHPGSGAMPKGLMAVAIATLVIGLIAATSLLTQGHTAFNTSSNVVWGLPVSAYVFFVLSSTGLTFVASVAMVFGIKDFYPIAKRCVWLAVATLVAGFISLGLEIGHPIRMIWAIPLNMQIHSPMFWMGAFYFLYLIFLLWKFSYLQKNDWDSGASRKVGLASFVTVVIAHGTLGLVFGMMAMRPYWYGSFVPVYFLVTAALSGVAFATLFTYLSHGLSTNSMSARTRHLMTEVMPKVFALTLGVVLLFTIARVITGLWTNNPEIRLVTEHMVGTGLFQFELWIGMVLPFALLLIPGVRSQPLTGVVASALVLIALFIGRFEYVVGGQMVPLFKGTWYPELLSYTPSLTEWGLVLVGSGVGLLIYATGVWKLRLDEMPLEIPADHMSGTGNTAETDVDQAATEAAQRKAG